MRTLGLTMLFTAAAFAAPKVYISANGAQVAKIWPGLPVCVQAAVVPAEQNWSFGSWTVALQKGDSAVNATFQGGSGEWWLDPELSGSLEPGEYRLQLIEPGGRTSNTVRVIVGETPEKPDFRDVQWNAAYEIRNGRAPSALNRVETWLEGHPDDPRALALRAELLQASGRKTEALIAYGKAIEAEEAVRKTQRSREPAGALYIRRDALMREMAGK